MLAVAGHGMPSHGGLNTRNANPECMALLLFSLLYVCIPGSGPLLDFQIALTWWSFDWPCFWSFRVPSGCHPMGVNTAWASRPCILSALHLQGVCGTELPWHVPWECHHCMRHAVSSYSVTIG